MLLGPKAWQGRRVGDDVNVLWSADCPRRGGRFGVPPEYVLQKASYSSSSRSWGRGRRCIPTNLTPNVIVVVLAALAV